MKTCTMCGVEKAQEEFRKYPNGRRYPYCLECQSIETRRRYLAGLKCLTDAQEDELNQINKLYEMRLAKGLKTFGGKPRAGSMSEIIAKQMKSLTN